MISFNVGPSKVHPEVRTYLLEAFDSGILSISHRSKEFDQLSEQTLKLLREKLNISADYTILYTGSATESWEIIAQDLVEHQSIHFFNGEFGKKWFEYARYIRPDAKGFAFDVNALPDGYFDQITDAAEVLCFTLNETSTGTQVPYTSIREAKKKNPEALVAIDSTSCLAGIDIPMADFDVIYGSVQKCFGLPAGLGLLICSPRAVRKAKQLNQHGRYNSLVKMIENIAKYQTNYTPNVLGIFLLQKVLTAMPNIRETHQITVQRAADWYKFLSNHSLFDVYIKNEEVRSKTVITVGATENLVQQIKADAKKQEIELGSGYGPLKNTTFRIANFPAISDTEIQVLKEFLHRYA